MSGTSRTAILPWVVAGAMVVAGIVTILVGVSTPSGAASFGWFAYQPLAGAVFVPGGSAIVLPSIAVAGWAVLAVGLIAAAFLAGRLAGRRSRR